MKIKHHPASFIPDVEDLLYTYIDIDTRAASRAEGYCPFYTFSKLTDSAGSHSGRGINEIRRKKFFDFVRDGVQPADLLSVYSTILFRFFVSMYFAADFFCRRRAIMYAEKLHLELHGIARSLSLCRCSLFTQGNNKDV